MTKQVRVEVRGSTLKRWTNTHSSDPTNISHIPDDEIVGLMIAQDTLDRLKSMYGGDADTAINRFLSKRENRRMKE